MIRPPRAVLLASENGFLTNINLVLLLVILSTGLSLGQQPNLAPASGSAPISFDTKPDQFGAVDKTLNLFTGDVQFPMSLVNLPGRNGLDVKVTASYSSNVFRQANTWNLEAPTGILGLGWSLDFPKIIVDNKATGTREDDTYYLSEGGTTNKLFFVSGDATSRVYQLKNYQFWQITFFPAQERWEIIKEDGSKFTYGDISSGRSTIQWVVHWNNWMGSSNVTDASIQKQQGVAWNLSEVKNIWGEKIVFSYLNIDQNVGGASGKLHTEASYLSTITDVNQNKVSFFYDDKSNGEYVEPHTENGDGQIDAYEERYEKKYLDYLTITDVTGLLLKKVDLSYSFIGSSNLKKRLLTSIIEYNSLNNALPGYQFNYVTTYNDNVNTGALSQIVLPTKGTINFSYAKTIAGRSSRNKKVAAPQGFAEPKIWIGADYVVVTWRKLTSDGFHSISGSTVKLQVFNWDGEWMEWDRSETLTGVDLIQDDGGASNLTDQIYDYQNFHVTMQRDFFATLHKPTGSSLFVLNIFRKNENSRNSWDRFQQSTTLSNSAPRKEDLVSGDNFVAICGDKSNIFTYAWNGAGWVSKPFT